MVFILPPARLFTFYTKKANVLFIAIIPTAATSRFDMSRNRNKRKRRSVSLASNLARDDRPAPQPTRRRRNKNRGQRRRNPPATDVEEPEVDEDGDVEAITKNLDDIEVALHSQESTQQRPQQRQRGITKADKTKFARNKMFMVKKASRYDVQKLCSAVGDMYTHIREYAMELGMVKESEDDMDWQPEPTTPVYLVRMTEEASCYPDGTVNRPWEGLPLRED
ncbi:hypothetical protein FALBO_11016 [Fusarium albosuccineum]|uniref:Uncharacterized protein n=1 Tax=Fusarium albosuccineum TaxID=1237068 RepID=A0A8H4L4K4_9HYPO|nr:hypothetical protein FALBO_11016 [Fusarium albosuccineum]